MIEYKNRHKTKNLQDKRFGEKDETLTQEEKNIQRQIKLAEVGNGSKLDLQYFLWETIK